MNALCKMQPMNVFQNISEGKWTGYIQNQFIKAKQIKEGFEYT